MLQFKTSRHKKRKSKRQQVGVKWHVNLCTFFFSAKRRLKFSYSSWSLSCRCVEPIKGKQKSDNAYNVLWNW